MNPFSRLRQFIASAAYRMKEKLTVHLLKRTSLGQVAGISVCDLSLPKSSPAEFLNLTREAMALIQQLDPRRHRRVCRHLDYIVNTELVSGGTFDQKQKICNVDYTKYFTSTNAVWNLRRYARLLIHEATHGYICDKGIPYDKSTRERIERLCHLEERRFVRHFEPEDAANYPILFNDEYYRWYWEGGKTWRDAWWRRIREAWSQTKFTVWNDNADKMDKGALGECAAKDASAYNELGLSYRRKGDSENAILHFSHAILLDRLFAVAYYNRGYEYHCMGEYGKALIDSNKAIDLYPKYAAAYSNRGLTYRHLGEYDKAIMDYDRAIELDPKFASAFNNRGYAFQCKGERDKAIADFNQAIECDKRFTLAYGNRARLYRQMGNYEKAFEDYAQVVHLDPTCASAYNNLAWILTTHPPAGIYDGKKAVEYATKACNIFNGKNPSAVNTLAMACANAGDFENAVKWQEQYLKTPDLSAASTAGAQSRLELYRAHKPLHGDE